MLKNLIEKREALVKEAEQMRTKLDAEKRTAFTAEERTSFDKIKNDLVELNERIKDESFLDEQKRSEVKSIFQKEERKAGNEFSIAKAMRSFLSGEAQTGLEKEVLEEGKAEFARAGYYSTGRELLIPSSILNARATNTASSAANWVKVNQSPELNIVQKPILWKQLGVTVYDQIEGGKLDLPNLADFTASFASEDTTQSDVSLSPGKATLIPRFLPATASFSRQLLAQTSPQIQNQLFANFEYALDAAIDKEMFAQLSGLTAIYTGNCSTYANMLQLEAGTNDIITAVVTSYKGRSYWKQKGISTGTTNLQTVWTQDNKVMGYPAFASPQVPNGGVYVGDFSDVAIGFFGGLIILEDPYSDKSKGNISVQVARLCDVKIANSAAFAISNKGSYI